MGSYPEAQGRLGDIYVGVDVFARGEVVGGKFETNKALELIRKHGLSAAIFAPGWVYETKDRKEFRVNQDRFWSLLSEFLYVHRPSSHLPFVSSFCQGFGENFFWKGKVTVATVTFSDVSFRPVTGSLRTAHHLPRRGLGHLPSDQSPAAGDQAWSRPSPRHLSKAISAPGHPGGDPPTLSKVCARIFSVHIPLASRTLVSFIYKSSEGVTVGLELKTTDAALCSYEGVQDVPHTSVQPRVLEGDHELVRRFTENCGCFLLELKGCALRDVCVNVSREEGDQDVPFSCRIGEIMVMDAESLTVPPLSVEDICLSDILWRRGVGRGPGTQDRLHLNGTLRWRYPAQLVRHFRLHWRRLRGPEPHSPPARSP
ncbi:hypothetical protein ANANG_G00297210 [Anguilla anguilla]|uniref:mannosyl-glycoprotein endo-beta-N-acetylglucosaminidase n=1 Tax=Anguilla anguilla TaxID=7936 RepID=A0A9D3LLZ5_ANGAN|nr:hypothetical protein ANANG_G00297210 [Anguilla anguilla]